MPAIRQAFAAVFFSLLISGTLQAAPIDPPTVALSRGTVAIVVADYRGNPGGNRILFDNVTRLQGFGEVPDLVELVAPDRADRLEVGSRYVVAYSQYKSSKTKQIIGDPAGAHALMSPGMEPAIWKADPQIESLALWRPDLDPAGIEAALPRLLAMLASSDLDMQRFAAAEIRFRPVLIAKLDAAAQRELATFAGREKFTAASARAAILAVAHDMQPIARLQQQWDSVALRILRGGPLDTMAHERYAELVMTAFERVERRGVKVNQSSLQRWLRSDDNALNEQALLALRRQSPEAERAALDKALRRSDLPADTRLFLEGHHQRLTHTTRPGRQ